MGEMNFGQLSFRSRKDHAYAKIRISKELPEDLEGIFVGVLTALIQQGTQSRTASPPFVSVTIVCSKKALITRVSVARSLASDDSKRPMQVPLEPPEMGPKGTSSGVRDQTLLVYDGECLHSG